VEPPICCECTYGSLALCPAGMVGSTLSRVQSLIAAERGLAHVRWAIQVAPGTVSRPEPSLLRRMGKHDTEVRVESPAKSKNDREPAFHHSGESQHQSRRPDPPPCVGSGQSRRSKPPSTEVQNGEQTTAPGVKARAPPAAARFQAGFPPASEGIKRWRRLRRGPRTVSLVCQ